MRCGAGRWRAVGYSVDGDGSGLSVEDRLKRAERRGPAGRAWLVSDRSKRDDGRP